MSEWISVKDRLPDDSETVLLFISSVSQCVDYDTGEPIGEEYKYNEIAIGYIKDGKLWINYDQDNIDEFKDVTH